MRIFNWIALLLMLSACTSSQPSEQKDGIAQYDGSYLDKFKTLSKDTLYVFNFWATWCGPCVKELPEFLELQNQYKGEAPLYMEFLSLDFPEAFDSILPNFVQEKLPNQNVSILFDPNMDAWIPKVSSSWSGAIPATLIVKNGKKTFIEGSVNFEELNEIITN